MVDCNLFPSVSLGHRGGVSGGHRQFKASPSKDTETPGQRSPGVSKEDTAGDGGRPAETNYVV